MARNLPRTYSSECESAVKETKYIDVEQHAMAEAHLRNSSVNSVSWSSVTVTVKDRATKQPKVIVDNVNGYVQAGKSRSRCPATLTLPPPMFNLCKEQYSLTLRVTNLIISLGEILAIMGPSGCGKTTLLNVLASRPTGAAKVDGGICVNGTKPSTAAFRQMSRFVEQEDALIGSLTVRETLSFATRLSTTGTLPKSERAARIDGLLEAFGLQDQADIIIGTPIRKGISGGQKRRTGIASQLITSPKILFLDEPTSGLDSAASFEVINYLKGVAKRNNVSLYLIRASSFWYLLFIGIID